MIFSKNVGNFILPIAFASQVIFCIVFYLSEWLLEWKKGQKQSEPPGAISKATRPTPLSSLTHTTAVYEFLFMNSTVSLIQKILHKNYEIIHGRALKFYLSNGIVVNKYLCTWNVELRTLEYFLTSTSWVIIRSHSTENTVLTWSWK